MTGRRGAVLAATLAGGFAVSGRQVWQSSDAAFTVSAANTGNRWHSGEVKLADGTYATDCSDYPAAFTNLTTSSDLLWLATNVTGYASGLGGWSASSTLTKTYRFSYVLSRSAPNLVQADTAQATLGWEAQT